ncbi:MAG: hypothetical protein AB1345_05455 [Chloroflexota bacterium]
MTRQPIYEYAETPCSLSGGSDGKVGNCGANCIDPGTGYSYDPDFGRCRTTNCGGGGVDCDAVCTAWRRGACSAGSCADDERRYTRNCPGYGGCPTSKCEYDADCACVPSCPVRCGQPDGCGSNCGNADNGKPSQPVLSPADGETVNLSAGEQVRVSWSSPAKADEFEIELYPVGADCSSLGAFCQRTAAVEYSFDPLASSYFYQVRGINTSCTVYDGSDDLGDWQSAVFTISGTITGTVRQDNENLAELIGGVCQLAGAPGIEPGAGSTVTVAGEGSGPVGADGSYSVAGVSGGTGQTVSLTIGDPSQWVCSCPSGCSYGGVLAPKSGLDFFVTNQREAWFQTEGGSVHANLGNVSSKIPSSCVEPACDPYLITGEAGLVSYSGGLDLGDFSSANISSSADDWQAQTSYQGLQTGYGYFKRLLEEDPAGTVSWEGEAFSAPGVYQADAGVIMEGRMIAGDEQFVAVVDGDVTVSGNIEVAEGGFLAVIASGNIIIADDVTDVAGVYIADGVIQTCVSSSCGSLAGGGGVA